MCVPPSRAPITSWHLLNCLIVFWKVSTGAPSLNSSFIYCCYFLWTNWVGWESADGPTMKDLSSVWAEPSVKNYKLPQLLPVEVKTHRWWGSYTVVWWQGPAPQLYLFFEASDPGLCNYSHPQDGPPFLQNEADLRLLTWGCSLVSWELAVAGGGWCVMRSHQSVRCTWCHL